MNEWILNYFCEGEESKEKQTFSWVDSTLDRRKGCAWAVVRGRFVARSSDFAFGQS